MNSKASKQWGCVVGSWPMTYLGVPLGKNPKSSLIWNSIEEKIIAKMVKWSNFMCSKGGSFTLADAVLVRISIDFLSIFQFPEKVVKNLEKKNHWRFFCLEWVTEECGSILVNWKTTSLPRCSGGLGIGNLKRRNLSLLAKWGWSFMIENGALWKDIIVSKHSFKMWVIGFLNQDS